MNGKNGAEAFRMAPNSSILLMDENDPIVWLKTIDGAGYCTVTPYTIAPYQSAPPVDVNSLGVNTETYEPQAVNAMGDSEFLIAVSGKNSTKAWAVMNELMDDLIIGNKRVYDRVMDKLRRV